MIARPFGVNVGSGQRPFHDTPEVEWLNVDAVEHEGMPKPDVVCDGAHLRGYPDESFDYYVLHQVLEHEGCGGRGLIEEAHRVLKPNGSLLVFVPDMRALAQRWLMGLLDDETYLINVYGAYMGHEEDRHKFGFTHATLTKLLSQHFTTVKDFDWRPIPGSDFARDWWVLAMEAIK